MDWSDFEQHVFADACRAIDEIAPTLPKETVIAFCLQCNSDPGTITIFINTEEGVARSLARYQQNPAFRNIKTVAEIPELRENPGDFSHKMVEPRGCFRNGRGYTEYIESIMNDRAISGQARDERIANAEARFMEAICRVMIRLQAEDKFSSLNRSSDFISVCVDRCEFVRGGLERMQRVRNQLARE
jgi:hypothetical protein